MAVNTDALFGKDIDVLDPSSTQRNFQKMGAGLSPRSQKDTLLNEKIKFINNTLRNAGLEQLSPFGFDPKNRNKTESDRIGQSISQSIDDIRKLNSYRNGMNAPGVSAEQKTNFSNIIKHITDPNTKTSGLSLLRGNMDEFGFDLADFSPVLQGFKDVGVQFEEGEFPGDIVVKPPSDIIEPTLPPTPPEDLLPPAPPPLEDIIGQPPPVAPPPVAPPPVAPPPVAPPPIQEVIGGEPPRGPTDVGGLPLPGAPTPPPPAGLPGVTPTLPPETPFGTPGAPAPAPVTGPVAADPRRSVIAIPDPRNPGKFIEVPITDRDLPPGLTPEDITGQFDVEAEALRQQEQSRKVFEQQRSLRGERLEELRSLLASEEERQFGLSQPGIEESLQSRGLLRSSALGTELSRERGRLSGISQAGLAAQSLADREAELQGISDILGGRQQLQTSGLERRFSIEDFEREAQLARGLGAEVAPSVSRNALLPAIQGATAGASAGSAFGPYGAAIGGIGGAVTGAFGASSGGGGGTYFCTKLYKMGLMTKREVKKVHNKIFSESFNHYFDMVVYNVFAPLCIERMSKRDYNWGYLKKKLCDEVIQTESSEEAFHKYRDVCHGIGKDEFPQFSFLFGRNTLGSEVVNNG